MVVTFSGITCPDDSSAEDSFDSIVDEKFQDLDMGEFENTLVQYQNYYTADKCKLTWQIAPEDGSDATPAELVVLYGQQISALYGSKKRFAVVEEESDASASGFQIECPSGSGAASSGYYCGKPSCEHV